MTRRMSLLGPSMPLQKVLDVVESHLQARPDMQCSMAGQDSVWKLDAKKMLQVQSSRCTRMAAHDGLKVSGQLAVARTQCHGSVPIPLSCEVRVKSLRQHQDTTFQLEQEVKRQLVSCADGPTLKALPGSHVRSV